MDSFGASTAPRVTVQGDGGTALAIGHAGGTVTWQVNGDGSGTATGAGAKRIVLRRQRLGRVAPATMC